MECCYDAALEEVHGEIVVVHESHEDHEGLQVQEQPQVLVDVLALQLELPWNP